MKKLNIHRLITDAGGAAEVSRWIGVHRTAPYGWIRQGFLRSSYLETIKANAPHINIENYFEERDNVITRGGSGTT